MSEPQTALLNNLSSESPTGQQISETAKTENRLPDDILNRLKFQFCFLIFAPVFFFIGGAVSFLSMDGG